MSLAMVTPTRRTSHDDALTTADTFLHWMTRARQGDRFVYHSGNLSQDVRLAIVGRKNARLPDTRLTTLRVAVHNAAKKGLIVPMQKVLPYNAKGQRSFEYLAIRTAEPWV